MRVPPTNKRFQEYQGYLDFFIEDALSKSLIDRLLHLLLRIADTQLDNKLPFITVYLLRIMSTTNNMGSEMSLRFSPFHVSHLSTFLTFLIALVWCAFHYGITKQIF